MKITFIGGGALRLVGVIDKILKRPEAFPDPHLVLMDLNLNRAQTVASLVKKMPSGQQSNPVIEITRDLDRSLDGADYVHFCIRPGGIKSLARDIRISAEHGFHGDEVFGPSAMMLAVRTVPVLMDITARMEKLCPGAWLLIFSNPLTELVDAVARFSRIRKAGFCSGVLNFAKEMNAFFGINLHSSDLVYRGGGLNHISWVMPDARYQGKLLMEIIRRAFPEVLKNEIKAPYDTGIYTYNLKRVKLLFDLYGVMPLNSMVHHHFFFYDELVKEFMRYFANTPSDRTFASGFNVTIAEAERLAGQEKIENFWETEPLKYLTSGNFPELGVEVMEALQGGHDTELILNLTNEGHIKGLPDGVTVEASTVVRSGRLEPLGIDPIPNDLKGFYNAVACFQRAVVDAIVKKDKNALLHAFLMEPSVRSYERAIPLFGKLWETAVSEGEVEPDKWTGICP